MKPLLACNYAIVRFRPYRETGEFVNVGLVMFCPQSGFFDLKLETSKHKRVTDFFPELDKDFFLTYRKNFHTELIRIRELLKNHRRPSEDPTSQSIFRELVKPRESVFRFGEIATILADDPALKLQELFDHFVNRQFAYGREYQEKVMAKQLSGVLRTHELIRFYRADQRVGNDKFHVVIPIVSVAKTPSGKVRRAIKPLDLDRDEPTKIYEHGDMWLKRVERLKQVNLLPEGLLFMLREPTTDDKRLHACKEIRSELTRLEVHSLSFDDEQGLLEFAKFNED